MILVNADIQEYLGHNGDTCRVRVSRKGKVTRFGSPNPFNRDLDFWQDLGWREDISSERCDKYPRYRKEEIKMISYCHKQTTIDVPVECHYNACEWCPKEGLRILKHAFNILSSLPQPHDPALRHAKEVLHKASLPLRSS